MFAYLQNLVKLSRRERTLIPLLAMYYVTTQCNLNCAYCEDFGARRNSDLDVQPTLEEATRILKVIRTGVSRLWLTGGEPLLSPYLVDLLERSRRDLKFREITLISNGTLLSQNLQILPFLDRLVISLDSMNLKNLNAINLTPHPLADVRHGVEHAAKLQRKHRFRLILNAVITPETLEGFESLLDFCIQNGILLSFSPQSFNNWPRYELLVSDEYQDAVKKIISSKKRGAPILGSMAYLKTLLVLQPYDCYPTLMPRIFPDGWLLYPCRPIEKDDGEQGGRPVNLKDVDTWDQAWTIAQQTYGEAPTACGSCFQQCYAEPSLMQSKPLVFLWESLRFNPSRDVNLSTYAPG
jgi:MoaA/NifB/PqqE/SkfB family radical SAM enzyme